MFAPVTHLSATDHSDVMCYYFLLGRRKMRAIALVLLFAVAGSLVVSSSATALSRALRQHKSKRMVQRVDSMIGRVFHGKDNSYRVTGVLSAPGDYDLLAAGRAPPFSPAEAHNLLGEGGNGRVFRATRIADGLSVAMKFMIIPSDTEFKFGLDIQTHPHLSAACKSYFPLMIDSFVLPADTAGGLRYVHVMEFLPGVALNTAIARGAFGDEKKGPVCPDDTARANRVWGLLNDAINCLHSVNLIHSDLKPENVMYRHDAVPTAITIKLIVCSRDRKCVLVWGCFN